MFNENGKTVGWVLKNIHFLDIETKFLPTGAAVVGGSAVLTLNSEVEKWFDILPQKDPSNDSGKVGWGYVVIASDLTSERDKFTAKVQPQKK